MEKKGAVRQRQSLVDMLRRRDPAGDIPFDADESEEAGERAMPET